MADVTASRLADYILSISRHDGRIVTNLKLQKLLYYCQAWYLAIANEALFDDSIEAWVHGPVVPSVFGRFKHYRWNPITDVFDDVRLAGGTNERSVEAHVKEVLEAYGRLSGPQLEVLTHQETPWREARIGLAKDQASNNIISLDAMKTYYRDQMQPE